MNLSEIFSWIVEADIRVLLGGVMIIGSIYLMYRLEIMGDKVKEAIKSGDKVKDEDISFVEVLKSFFNQLMSLIISIGLGVGGVYLIYVYHLKDLLGH